MFSLEIQVEQLERSENVRHLGTTYKADILALQGDYKGVIRPLQVGYWGTTKKECWP